jgi:hypothetical protein
VQNMSGSLASGVARACARRCAQGHHQPADGEVADAGLQTDARAAVPEQRAGQRAPARRRPGRLRQPRPVHRDRAPHPARGRPGGGGRRVLHRAICGSRPGPRLVHLRPRLDPPPRRRGRRGYRAGRPVDLHPPRCAPHRAVALAARELPRCQPPTVGMRDRPRTAESPPTASSQSRSRLHRWWARRGSPGRREDPPGPRLRGCRGRLRDGRRGRRRGSSLGHR